MSNIRDLLKKTLLETPINDIDLVSKDPKGNVSKDPEKFLKTNSSFGKRDEVSKKILTSPKGIEKLRKKFENTDATFDMVFYNGKEGKKYTEYGSMTPDEVKKNLGIDVKPNPENVTIIYVGNNAAEKVMMTPWIIAHRMGHAMSADARKSRDKWNPWNRYTGTVGESFNKAAEAYGKENLLDADGNLRNQNDSGFFRGLIESICTFKSARDKSLLRPTEVYYEVFAQFLTSTPKFNPIPVRLSYTTRSENYAGKTVASKTGARVIDAEMQEMADMYFNDLIQYNLPDYAGNVVAHYTGKILVM